MEPGPIPEGGFRVAIVGSGPAGFFLAERLLASDGPRVRVDVLERLPAPFGLLRYGVAPDHQRIKSVAATFERTASRPGFRFLGNVEVGRDVGLEVLLAAYDAVVLATGAQSDRRLGIPGEDLPGSYPATEFVAWYNGHPDVAGRRFDLSCARAVVVGVGNVAVDVARVLLRSPAELAATDTADAALEALRASRVREVVVLARRGAAQAACTVPEIRELAGLEGVDATARADEVAFDDVSRAAAGDPPDRETLRKVEALGGIAARPPGVRRRRLTLRFKVSPVEILPGPDGRVGAVRIVHNDLRARPGGGVVAAPTSSFETIRCGLVLRSVGYRGVPVAGAPFDARRGIVPNRSGRVIDPESGAVVRGLYACGWIKRGPTGVIGTNKPDAAETAVSILEDLRVRRPRGEDATRAVEAALGEAGVRVVRWEDWLRVDRVERERGSATGRPRVKLTTFDDLLGKPAAPA